MIKNDFILMGWTLLSREEANEILDKIEGTYAKTHSISPKEEVKDDDKREASFFAFFEDLSSAEPHIKSMVPVFTIVILVDLGKDKAFVYKGPNITEIKKIHLPKLFSFYERAGMGEHPCLESIEDLRILYNNPMIKNMMN